MPIITARCMNYDDVAWAKCDEIFEPWKKKIFERDVLREVGRFVDKHRGGVPTNCFRPDADLSTSGFAYDSRMAVQL
jgi:hypothetical protein